MKEYEILKAKIKELEKQNSILRKEIRQFKRELLQTKSNPKSKPTPIRFYLNDKTIRLVKKSIDKLKQIDPISGWFVHILSITGCRGVEIQNIRLDDIVRETNNNGDVFYSLRVNVSKKRSNICIREVVINKSEFESIEEIHKFHFKNKGYT
ncbi:hypothetical protein [Borrelia duttonii]|uniref:hypothetical protein n=1 Tax=Borrelia duttonii TaxID=40834 RepID=UPI0002F09318